MKKRLLFTNILFFFFCFYTLAQVKKDSTLVNGTTNTKPLKQKDVKKLDDPLLLLPQDLIYKIQHMKPDPLLDLNERIVRNERRTDEYGEDYEVTVTVRLGFSQDMITGIVKEVPLYQSASREINIVQVKIPVKFCCTTKIDSVHTKKHCGKMSELNDFEEFEHCKDWIQDNGESASNPDAVTGFRPKTIKKGVTGKTTAADSTGFGKPNTKISKKEAKANTDSTATNTKGSVKSKKESPKKEKAEPVKKEKSDDGESFGKPKAKEKGKGKSAKKAQGKDDSEEQQPVTTDSTSTGNKKER